MLPDHPALVRCPACDRLFWVDEAVQIDSGFDAAAAKLQVSAPSEKEVLTFLAGPALPKDKEIYLRMRAWWAANDAWRWVPNATPAFSKDQVKNLKALSAMLDEAEPNQRIIKAEIAREIGEFEECLLLWVESLLYRPVLIKIGGYDMAKRDKYHHLIKRAATWHFRKSRVRFSLETTDAAEAMRKRDKLLENYRLYGEFTITEVEDERLTFGAVVKEWVEIHSKKVKYSSWRDYRSSMNTHVLPAFKDCPISAIAYQEWNGSKRI